MWRPQRSLRVCVCVCVCVCVTKIFMEFGVGIFWENIVKKA